jgi:hypothetical protein
MDRKSINLHVMQEKSFVILDENRLIFQDNPVIIEKIDQLGVYNNEVKALNDIQTGGTKGNTMQKAILKDKMVNATIVVKAGLRAFGASIKDQKILEITGESDKSLSKKREDDTLSYSRVILNLAKKHASELVIWNVKQDKIDNLESAITSLTSIIPTNHNAKADITQINIETKQKLKEAKDLLDDEIDLMVAPFGVDNPGFYARYQKAREIIEIAATHSTEETPESDNKTQNN